MLVPLVEEVSTTALKETAVVSVDWHPHRAQPMKATTHRVEEAAARGKEEKN